MGSSPSSVKSEEVPLSPAASALCAPGLQSIRMRQIGFFSRYVAQCNAHRGAVLTRYVGDGFPELLAQIATCIVEEFLVTGRISFVKGSVYVEVLRTELEGKIFNQHLRGLECVAFLALPSVTVPRAGIIKYRGVTLGAMSLHHLLQPASTAGPLASAHVTTVRVVLSKVLRLKSDVAAVFYEGGDGSLTLVDASAVLPVLSLHPSGSKPWHQARPELVIARDNLWPPTAAAETLASSAAAAAAPDLPGLSAVISSATSSKQPFGPLLHLYALLALGPSNTIQRSLDDKLRTVAVATRASPFVAVEYGIANLLNGTPLTRYLLGPPLLDATVDLIETSAAEIPVSVLIHRMGLGMHLLGVLWTVAVGQHNIVAKQRIAVEIVARASKVWLDRFLWSTHTPTAGVSKACSAVDATILELFRGVHDDGFLDREIMPVANEKFGSLNPPIRAAHIPFRIMSARLTQLVGITLNKGAIMDVSPRIRIARWRFELTAAEERTLAEVAVRRDDPMSVAALLSSFAVHARSVTRISSVVQQLRSRRLDNAVLLMFVALLELQVADVHLGNKNIQAAAESLETAVPSVIAARNANSSHDSLFATRHGLRLVNLLTRLMRLGATHTYMRQVLQLGALRDLSNSVNAVSARQMLEEYHKSAVEGFAQSRDEALLVAQSWVRWCPHLFGPTSPQNCRATKMVLVCLLKCHKHREALAAANDFMSLALRAFGPNDVHTAMAMNDVATLTWRRDPRRGLKLYQSALEVFRRSAAGSRQVPSTLYNMALAAMRLNQFRHSLRYLALSREAAMTIGDRSAMETCDRMQRAVYDIAATKLQRWVRDCMYGVAPSQTSRTTDLCSTLTWSDKTDEASTAGDLLQTSAVIAPDTSVETADLFE